MTLTYHSEKEAAEYLGVSQGTLRNWRWLKRGPRAVKFVGTVRYRLDDLKDFVDHSLTCGGGEQ